MIGEKISGYGPPDLIEKLKRAIWEPCWPSGNNFEGMTLGGYVLTDTPDELCSAKFRVTVETQGEIDSFEVEGYCFPDMPLSVRHELGRTNFAGHSLATKSQNKNSKLFQVIITTI